MDHRQRLEELCEADPELLKEIVLHDSKYSDRLLVQIKCVWKYKYEESKRQNKDIGWNGAWTDWREKGYASKFAEVYNDELTFTEIYKRVV